MLCDYNNCNKQSKTYIRAFVITLVSAGNQIIRIPIDNRYCLEHFFKLKRSLEKYKKVIIEEEIIGAHNLELRNKV